MTKPNDTYTVEMLAEAVRSSQSLAEAMRKLGLTPTGNRYNRFKREIAKEGLDTSHMLGKGWNKAGQNLRQTIWPTGQQPTKYPKAVLEEAVKNSQSVAQVMRLLGVRPAGGSHAHLRRRLTEFGIDTSHFLGKGWNAGGSKTSAERRRTAQQILVLGQAGQRFEPTRLLRRALLEIGRTYQCAICELGAQWNGESLVLQIDHINGLRYDNRAENLRFLCPNCHSQTENFNRPHR